MYGLIGKMSATPGQRDALADILLSGTGTMPGCLSYAIAKGRPLIAGFSNRVETVPLGGYGLK
jgi:quinol monooxygenase YgiN